MYVNYVNFKVISYEIRDTHRASVDVLLDAYVLDCLADKFQKLLMPFHLQGKPYRTCSLWQSARQWGTGALQLSTRPELLSWDVVATRDVVAGVAADSRRDLTSSWVLRVAWVLAVLRSCLNSSWVNCLKEVDACALKLRFTYQHRKVVLSALSHEGGPLKLGKLLFRIPYGLIRWLNTTFELRLIS